MRRRNLAFVAAVGLSLSGCNGCVEGELVALTPAIVVEPLQLDLGEVPFSVTRQGAVTIRNVGNAVLTLDSVSIRGGETFTISKPPRDRVEPSRSEVLLIEATAPVVRGSYATTLVIESNDPESPIVEVPLRLVAVQPPPCDDGNVCTEDWFDEATAACAHRFADGTTCFPADKCIIDAVCAQGVCLGAQKACDDNSPCTADFCRQIDGECLFVESPSICEDDNPCTEDSCSPAGCANENLPSGVACDDGDLCTVQDSCFQGNCTGRGAQEGGACDDHDSCTSDDICVAGACTGVSIVDPAAEGDLLFKDPQRSWTERAFLHRREVSLSRDTGVFYGLDHLTLPNQQGLTHVVSAMKQCGTEVYSFEYRPPDANVQVSYVRRGIQIGGNDQVRMYVGVRQRPDDGWRPQTTTYVLAQDGAVVNAGIQTLGGETGRSLLPDGSHIFGRVLPLTNGPPTAEQPSLQNLVIVREDFNGNVLWRHERTSGFWAEYLGVAGPRVLFWADGRFGALDFNTGAQVWSQATAFITKEMALSTSLNLGVARVGNPPFSLQLIGVEILEGRQVFQFPPTLDETYFPRTDPVIAADGRILVIMERRDPILQVSLGLEWVELNQDGQVLTQTPLPYIFPAQWGETRHEDYFDDPYPTVADDGVSYVGYGDTFWAINPGGQIRWTLTSTIPNAFTGTVPLLRDDGVLLINEGSRSIIGVRTNGGQMSDRGWPSFRHDGERTNFTP